MKTIFNKDAKHQYSVDVVNPKNVRETIDVDANTRLQAQRIAQNLGYIVRSVNMIG
jgi:hypothetical protein